MKIIVNGEELSDDAVQFELHRLLRFYAQHMPREELQKQMDVLKKKAADQAIGAKLLLEAAGKLDMEPPPGDVEGRIEEMIEGAGGEDKFKETLAGQNLTLDMVKEGITRGRRVDMLVDKLTEGVSDPTEAEMRDHFDSHAHEYRKSERAQAQHILIKPETESDEDRQAAQDRLADIRKQIEGGADFAQLAAEHSECPSGKSTGGSLGWFSRGMMVPEFDNAVFSMSLEELSEIVETQFGYHIIKKLGQEEPAPAEFEEVAEKVRDFLRHARRGSALSEHVAELRSNAQVEIVED
jgi:parvulin-like peptidyl-prolyl isomerase